MNKKKIKIYVACHKPDECKNDEVFTPIHVGRSISKYGSAEMNNMIGDDIGDNISSKNPYYCELTAQYWIWKNVNDIEYVGLAHYRRYFKSSYDNYNIAQIMKDCDIVLSRRLYEKFSMYDKIEKETSSEDLMIFLYCIKKFSPEYYHSTCEVMRSNWHSPYNMFIMKKTEFDKYAAWQFDILGHAEELIKLSNYSRQKRVIGYLSELMFTIYCMHNHMRIKYDSVVNLEGEEINSRKYKMWRNLYVNLGFKLFTYRNSSMVNRTILQSLINDGIQIEDCF